MRDLGVTEGDISATTGHSIATKRRSDEVETKKQNGNIAPFGDSVINASF